MRIVWIFFCGISIFLIFSVEGTYRHEPTCECNGKAHHCTVDNYGLRCLNCQENTEGRQCERCKEGFYHQKAGEACQACHCNSLGSTSPRCDHQGLCSCKPNIQGDKCDRCSNGAPLTHNGCAQTCRPRRGDEPGDDRPTCLPCFCYGHSSDCALAKGYSIHNISSAFRSGPEGWRAAAAQGQTPSNVHFRWSLAHRDLEVISRDSNPIYFYAPATYLGNQMLSYGQTLSFSLRLDRGVRRPSSADVVLEGAGLRVSAALGDLRTILPCGHKTTYTFRLDELTGSKWKPQLTSLQFQKLLQNLTAIMIRGTFGENGRGYLDDVQLVSASLGPGSAAGWVENCSCPVGYKGQFCERCAAGYKRRDPSDGPLSRCEPCSCHGGSCDPETGDCFSGDETPGDVTCPLGFYRDPEGSSFCRKCPCPEGAGCSVTMGTSEVKCDRCPPGLTGPDCSSCQDGFYGDPLGTSGPRRQCRHCQCNGHIDQNAVGNCDRLTGECLKCLNYTTGFFCERCQEGYYRSFLSHSCRPCSCDPLGSTSKTCSNDGQCLCRKGFEGLQCERSGCPACFDQVKNQMGGYTRKLKEMETLFNGIKSGSVPVNNAQMEGALKAAETLVADLQRTAAQLSDSENELLDRLSKIIGIQSGEARDLQDVARAVSEIKRHDQQYQNRASDIQLLLSDTQRKLHNAKMDIKRAELPSSDSNGGTNTLSGLADSATTLADKHQKEAAAVRDVVSSALKEAEKALVLMRSAVSGENKVTESINDLKAKFDRDSARVKAMEGQAARLSSSAEEESRVAADALKQISSLERGVPNPLKKEMDSVLVELDYLSDQVETNLTGYQVLQSIVQAEQSEVEILLAKGKAAQQVYDELLSRADVAKAIADASLKDINNNLGGVDDVLNKLRGFDEQIGVNRAQAEDAIKRLMGINATIQEAVGSNTQNMRILKNVDGDYNQALKTISQLGDVVAQMEGFSSTLKASSDFLRDTTQMHDDLEALKSQAESTVANLNAEVDSARQQEDRAKEASAEAAAAYENAKNTKDAVGKTLLVINNLLSSFGQPGSMDEVRLNQLERSIANARSQVNQQLKPRLKDLEELGARQRAQLSGLDADIDQIQKDIENLKDIRKTIPTGCFNSPPIERP